VEETTQVPAVVSIKDCQVEGQILVTFNGHPVGGRLRDRAKTAWHVLTGRANRLYNASTTIVGCHVTCTPAYNAIQVGVRTPSLYERFKTWILGKAPRSRPAVEVG